MTSCRRHTAPKGLKKGILLSAPRDSDRVVERELIQCCHCQFTAVWVPGLEKGWAVCGRCKDWHCSKPSCRQVCLHHRKWRDLMSAGRADLANGGGVILGRVEAEPPRG